jgi:hypothetical protein
MQWCFLLLLLIVQVNTYERIHITPLRGKNEQNQFYRSRTTFQNIDHHTSTWITTKNEYKKRKWSLAWLFLVSLWRTNARRCAHRNWLLSNMLERVGNGFPLRVYAVPLSIRIHSSRTVQCRKKKRRTPSWIP